MRNPVMIGERVYLRAFEVDDATAMAEATHYEVETFMDRGRDLTSPLSYESMIRGLHEGVDPPDSCAFAICLVEDDRCIGLVDLEGIDLINRGAETGTWIHDPDCRGKGYGTEAKHLLLEYCFDRLHLERVRAWVFESNPRSAAALVKQGYRAAGRLKYHDVKDGRFQDMLAFDLTSDEWRRARESVATGTRKEPQ
jgi:RimJ/RimL family protein N-acetyltransferase